jgi:hypothetical protein
LHDHAHALYFCLLSCALLLATPALTGIRTNKEVKMGIHNSMERFLATLDSFLASNGARLQVRDGGG